LQKHHNSKISCIFVVNQKFTIMAIPIRAIPVLEGEVARRFEREMKKAEKERGTIKVSQKEMRAAQELWEKSKRLGFLKNV
jgi:hypothetical protein